MLSLNLLRMAFSHSMDRWFNMTVIGSPSIGVILTDAEGFKQGLQLEKCLIFVVRQHISQDRARLMIDGVP
jgi:hypothetical protein